jgi:hypothetical protein
LDTISKKLTIIIDILERIGYDMDIVKVKTWFKTKVYIYVPLIIYIGLIGWLVNSAMYGTYKWLIGFGGLIIIALVIIIWNAFGTKANRENTMMYVRYVETALFGKPLDKEYWNKGEKPRLPKFVWKKRKQEEKIEEGKK